jgi:hypothetical protein
MTIGFDKLAADLSMGAFFLVIEAPTDRAFTQAFWEGKVYRPSQTAFENALRYNLITYVDSVGTYKLTPHGQAFRSFVTNKVVERPAVYA